MLVAGTRVGPYEVTGAIGAGGMGEVYRARDARLGRDVAIKIIPAGFAADPDRLQRFEQEARAAAALSHPNILVVHDLGTHEGTPYIVTELLEGETLREQVTRGALPMRTAIDYAVQVARGLAAAHAKGIVHRDLKPENIFITVDGRLKILDFGLAKLTQVEVAGLGSALPTIPPLPQGRLDTTPGMVLGTIGYMSPEQVKGVPADHRADIFALGAILYEMLAGRRAFRGESTIETMTAILRDQPAELEHSDRPLPPALQRVVEHCLEKRPELRFQSAQDVAFALETLSGSTDSRAGTQTAFPTDAASPRSRAVGWRLATAVAALAVIAIAPSAVSHWREQPPTLRPTRFSLDLPANVSVTFSGGTTPWFEASPDGRYVAFRAASSGERARVWIRPLDGLTARPLTETENVQVMFWSPDSRSLAFTANGLLRALNIGDGVARTVAKLPQAIGQAFPLGGAWSNEGVILLSGPGATGSTIWRVSAQGGELTPVTRQETNGYHAFPVFLSDGRRFLFSKLGAENGLYLGTLDAPDVMRLSSDYMQPKFAAGFLLFARAQTLMAQPFDQVRGTLSSEPAVVVDGVTSNSANGRTAFSVSDQGVLVFASGTVELSEFTWFTRAGQPDGIVTVPNSNNTVALAPDGREVVYARREPGGGNQSLWVTDLTRSVTTRLTFGDSRDSDGTWSPDMSRIIYSSVRQGNKSLYEMPASGGTERLVLKEDGRSISPDDWSPDGRILLYHFDGGPELWALPLEGDRKPFLVVKSAGNVDEPAFSPDGKWIAYNSNESGRTEVYIAPFPPTGARWQVSSSGGMQPTWRRDGRELFFLQPDGTVMAVDISLAVSVELGTLRPLFQTRLIPSSNIDQYAVSPDGKRFLIMNPVGEETEAPPTVILDWPALLNRP